MNLSNYMLVRNKKSGLIYKVKHIATFSVTLKLLDHVQEIYEHIDNFKLNYEEYTEMSANDYQVDGSHYKDMPVEPWDVMQAVLTKEEFMGFLKGCIIKYSMRAGRKANSDDGAKAKHYMEKLTETRVVW